ncbi:MAG: hypothetical protein CME64_05845 [Halobacteriovoraceae bacterium]|nr:hypothetical protein [Halobacteriovoraceae bacterium]
MKNLDIYKEIEDNLENSRQAILAYNEDPENDEELRSLDQANLILQALKQIAESAFSLFEDYPSLEAVFEKEYGSIKQLTDRESIVETCFLDDFILPDKESLPLIPGQEISNELVDNYVLSFKDWEVVVRNNHLEAQELIKERFSTELKPNALECPCQKCIADFRAKLRDQVFKDHVEIIAQAEDALHELVLDKKISFISDYYSKLKKRIEKNLQRIRYKLKRGSLNKLDSDIKMELKSKLGPNTELGRVYRERLITFFNSILDEEDISPDLITSEEYDRFFTQLGLGMWKSPGILKREFLKLTRSVMAFKRKDISATILREYLGQFWVHSEARRKTRKIVYHMGPTNSGKTYNAIEALAKAEHGCYLAPLRLLASELYDTLNDKGVVTNLLTGEEVIEQPGATHYSSTIEMARMSEAFDVVVIDEIQMITDIQRGWAWTRALVNINADEIHLCGDHSVLDLVKQILSLTGDELEIKEYTRMTKLDVMNKQIKLTELEKHDALIVFSRRNALKYKMDLEKLGFKVSIVYGRLSPEVRREQARKFDQGETDIMVSTDAIAMGMNLPIKRIVFSATSKFYNSKEHPITESEIKQIAGRAGRFGRFPEGKVTALKKVDDGLDIIRTALNTDLDQKELAMVGPDLEIFRSVNKALEENSLKTLHLSEFLRLFNTMTFEKPFYCVDLKEMIEVTEMVEGVDEQNKLSDSEVFGFSCAPVNLGLLEHVQYFVWIASHYVKENPIINEEVDEESDDIDYLERAIKCVELYQWLARHFDNNNFSFSEKDLLANKMAAIEKLNQLLSEKVSQRCSSCGVKLPESFDFNICEACFGARRFSRPRRRGDANRSGGNKGRGPGKPKYGKDSRPPKGKPSKKRGKRPGAKKRGAKKSSPFTKG